MMLLSAQGSEARFALSTNDKQSSIKERKRRPLLCMQPQRKRELRLEHSPIPPCGASKNLRGASKARLRAAARRRRRWRRRGCGRRVLRRTRLAPTFKLANLTLQERHPIQQAGNVDHLVLKVALDIFPVLLKGGQHLLNLLRRRPCGEVKARRSGSGLR